MKQKNEQVCTLSNCKSQVREVHFFSLGDTGHFMAIHNNTIAMISYSPNEEGQYIFQSLSPD